MIGAHKPSSRFNLEDVDSFATTHAVKKEAASPAVPKPTYVSGRVKSIPRKRKAPETSKLISFSDLDMDETQKTMTEVISYFELSVSITCILESHADPAS